MGANRVRLSRNNGRRLGNEPLAVAPIPPLGINRDIEPAWVYTAITGNRRLLAGLDSSGEIAQLFYPHIDAGPHVRSWLTGVEITSVDWTERDSDGQAARQSVIPSSTSPGRNSPVVSWLASSAWSHAMRYEGATPTLRVTSTHASGKARVERTLFVADGDDLLVNEITVTNLTDEPINCRLVVYASFDPYYRSAYNTAYFDVANETLALFGSDVYFAFRSDAPVLDFATSRLSTKRRIGLFDEVTRGEWSYDEYNIGQVNAAVRYEMGEIRAGGQTTSRLNLCCGADLAGVTALAARACAEPPQVEAVNASWRRRQAHPPLAHHSDVSRAVFDRSLSVISLLTDRSGGIIAAAEPDPDFLACGGYGLCWPRDGAFIAHALDKAGRHTLARQFYDWALRAQEPEGLWYQRYFTTGKLAPTWGLIQFDETGAVVWAICQHIAMTHDDDYARRVWPQLLHAGEYMRTHLDADLGLAPITKDLWEERQTVSTYASACTWGAFHQLSVLAETLGDHDAQALWSEAADALKSAISQHLWDDERGYFVRGRKLKVSDHTWRDMISGGAATADDFELTHVLRKEIHLQQIDLAIDTSSLALSVPFGVFSPDDPRMVATARAVETHLTSPVGGIFRYQYDGYRGGNPWVICSLWLAWQLALSGQTDAAWNLFHWAEDHRTPLDLLPEQVNKYSGEPHWVTPLGWSHAMYIIVARMLDGL